MIELEPLHRLELSVTRTKDDLSEMLVRCILAKYDDNGGIAR
jgi:hypothetical protein